METTETVLQKNQPNCWNNSDQARIVEALTVLINGQKAYGKEYSIKDTFAYYRMKLESRFTVDQVLYAVDRYTDLKNDMPAPADIIKILNPEKPKITEAQFVEAQKWQERNGWPMMSDAQDTIDEYRRQNDEKRKNHTVECDKIREIAAGSVKRIT